MALTLDERLTNVEASLSLVANGLERALKDGEEGVLVNPKDVTDDELGAVLEEVFGELRDLKARTLSLQKQLTMVGDILDSATRKNK